MPYRLAMPQCNKIIIYQFFAMSRFLYAKFKKILIFIYNYAIVIVLFGGIAQLGERLNGIQEVSGSIPLISTKGKGTAFAVPFFTLQNNMSHVKNSYRYLL